MTQDSCDEDNRLRTPQGCQNYQMVMHSQSKDHNAVNDIPGDMEKSAGLKVVCIKPMLRGK